MPSHHHAWSCALVALACNVELTKPVGGDSPVEAQPVERAATPPPPITGGTLLVTRDGAFAIASDPDRDVVHVVDLATLQETATIALASGARPFRAAEDAAGRVHVTLRGTGQLATIDPRSGELSSIVGVCPNPRGIAHDEARDAMAIACAGGELVTLAADDRQLLARRMLVPDLRDVFVEHGTTYVSRFRSAEVLEVLDEGTTQAGAPESPTVGAVLRTPGTAWRTVPHRDGGWVMLHQLATSTPLPAPPPGGGGDFSQAIPEGYGGITPCGGASNPSITVVFDDGSQIGSGPIAGIALAVDVAISPDGWTVAIASPSQHRQRDLETKLASLTTYPLLNFTAPDECRDPNPSIATDDFVAVAYAPDGRLLALTRSRPQLYVFAAQDPDDHEVVELEGDEIRDTGHDLFHLDAHRGISCASCHPEGGDDGRVWAFVDQGPRRTQPLDVGIDGTAPFHWRGDMADLPTLVHEVRQRRMGGAVLSDAHVEAFSDWLLAIPKKNPERSAADTMVEAGAALFDTLGCRSCHAGAALTNNAAADLGMGSLQIPNLHGVAMRPPYMHDGRCTTLHCATTEMLAATRPDVANDEQVDALVAYLESL
ncbi:MAG TPA: c-type cytochrome [Nannocystaceae bacterium]|nr:c-type cytochrome [Nannocystaceae bacterium]